MWPGQQPPGGEQNPQDPNQNPYQQPGYQQQPNPYQQPGYQQQPNSYAQQPGQPGWHTPVDPLGAPQPPQGGGGGNKTKVVAIVAAAAVVVAAGVTGLLVLGGDKDDTANDSGKKGPATSAPASKKPSAPASGGGDNPRGSESEKPTVPGWKVVVNPRFGTKFDVPADWELESADTSVGFEWEEKGKMDRTTVTAPASLKSKWCTDDSDKDGREEDTALATAGTRGENGATSTAQAAETRVPWWIFGGYTQPDKKSVKPGKPKPFTTTSGLKGSVATAYSQNTPQKGKCATDGKAITFAFKNGDGDYVTWNLYGAKGVDEELPEATIQKILLTVRLTEDAPTGS